MKEITKIVVPVDLDKHTQKLVDFSLYIAGKMDAHVSFIHVVELFVFGDMTQGASRLEKIDEERVEKGTELVNKLVEENKKKYPNINGIVWKGDPSGNIIKYAAQEQAGLVIIGTHGTKGLEKILLGSVAERVLKGVHCPTLMMNPYK